MGINKWVTNLNIIPNRVRTIKAPMSYPIGRCCAGDNCVAPTHELRPDHKCPGCGGFVHTLCGEFDNDSDGLYCKPCFPCPSATPVSVDGNGSPITKEKPPDRITFPTSNDCTEVSTTITDNVESEEFTIITYDYFLTKNQRLNNTMKARDGEKWAQLNNKVMNAIDGELKDRMIMEAQRMNLTLMRGDQQQLVSSFKEIGKVWKMIPLHDDTARKINQIINGQFENNRGYEFYIETEVMKRLRLVYNKNIILTGTHCIAMMVTRRKCDLAKSMMARGEKTHGFKIRKIRTKAEVKEEGPRRPKVKQSYQLLGREGNNWYTKEGEDYSETSGSIASSSRASSLIAKDEQIAELTARLEKTNQVCFLHVHFI